MTDPNDAAKLGGEHLVLIGMMGSGKTTVGRRLADRLGRPFLDSDEAIERQTGRTVAQIFTDEGEAAFRSLETDVLTTMLDRDEPAVIAAAGGAVLDAANRAHMRRRGTVVWLRADASALTERVRSSTHRPLLDGDPEGTLRRLAIDRQELYRETADRVVDVDELPPDAVVDVVLALVGAAV
jgi:shikimate kinase